MRTLKELVEPTVELTESTTLGDIELLLRSDELSFLRVGEHWEAVLPRLVVGLPSSRRVIDVPRVRVEPILSSTDPVMALAVVDLSPFPSSPVVEGGRLLGRLTHARLRRLLDPETEQDVLAELSTLRMATLAIVHDLANALLIAGAAAQLLDGEPDPSLLPSIEHANVLVDRLRSLVRGGTQTTASVELRSAVERLLPVLQALAKGHSLVCALGERDIEVWCPPSLIDRILINLVSNSCDAMASGGAISIALDVTDGPALLRVSDDGPGVAIELLPRVLEPGFTTKGGAHQGLGLHSLRRAVRRLGGELRLDSRPGEGTLVTVSLPRARPPRLAEE